MIKLNLDDDPTDSLVKSIEEHLKDDPLMLELVLNMIALNTGMHHIFDKLEEHGKRLEKIEKILRHL